MGYVYIVYHSLYKYLLTNNPLREPVTDSVLSKTDFCLKSEKGDEFSFDLKSGYHHIDIHKQHWEPTNYNLVIYAVNLL